MLVGFGGYESWRHQCTHFVIVDYVDAGAQRPQPASTLWPTQWL